MKRVFIILIVFFFVSDVYAQVSTNGTGFKMEFDFEDGLAKDIVTYEGVRISYNLTPTAEGTFKIINGELEWHVNTWSIFTLDFYPSLDLSRR